MARKKNPKNTWWYCLVHGHDRYVVPLWLLGVCKNCGRG